MSSPGERIRKNNAYYSRFAEKAAERTENRDFSRAFEIFLKDLDRNGTVIDIGSGAGIHLKHFKNLGISAAGIEPAPRMRELAAALGVDSIDGSFETLEKISFENVSGVWCASSLLHVPKGDFNSVMQKVSNLLAPRGRLYLTVRLGEGAKWDKWDDDSGDAERFIQLYSENELAEAISSSGLRIVESWTEDSYWGRPSKWISIVAVKL